MALIYDYTEQSMDKKVTEKQKQMLNDNSLCGTSTRYSHGW